MRVDEGFNGTIEIDYVSLTQKNPRIALSNKQFCKSQLSKDGWGTFIIIDHMLDNHLKHDKSSGLNFCNRETGVL